MSHAEDVRTGFACADCGVMFTKPHGIMVLCSECFDGAQLESDSEETLPESWFPEVGDDD